MNDAPQLMEHGKALVELALELGAEVSAMMVIEKGAGSIVYLDPIVPYDNSDNPCLVEFKAKDIAGILDKVLTMLWSMGQEIERLIDKTDADPITGNPDWTFRQVRDKRKKQDEKWGEQNHHPAYWLNVLTEEVGEAAKASVEFDYSHMRSELLDVAAVAIAAIESLDRDKWPRSKAQSQNADVDVPDQK